MSFNSRSLKKQLSRIASSKLFNCINNKKSYERKVTSQYLLLIKSAFFISFFFSSLFFNFFFLFQNGL